jgi:predicted metal-dependent phosphotriesterase family hydrolase
MAIASASRIGTLGAQPAVIQSVTGPIPASGLGMTLSHEHVFSRFGVDPSDAPAYDEAELQATISPYLSYLHALGVRTIADATAMRFGRHPRLLQDLSRASGMQILTNTGVYGAAADRYVPDDAREATPAQLADAWIREVRDGIGDTGIRPGFIKIGVDAGPLSALDRRLVEAGARTHATTGLLLAVHTGDNGAAAREQMEVLASQGVSAAAWVWVHASASNDDALLWEVAGNGGWLGLDSLRPETFDRHIALVLEARRRGLLGRVLLSHDGNSWPASGRLPRDYDLLLTSGRRRLRQEGLSEADLHQLLVDNPREAFTPRVRRMER